MLRVHTVHRQTGHVKVLQDAQRDQSRNALAIGRNLVQGVATVVLRDGCDPFGFVVGKVTGGDAATVGGGEFFNRLRNLAAIKSCTLGLRNGTQAFGCSGKLEQLAHLRRTAPRQKVLGKARQALQLGRGSGPLLLHHHRQQVTTLGNLNRGLQQVFKGQLAKALAHRHPTGHGAGHRDRVKATLGRRFGVHPIFTLEVLRRPGLRGATGGIQAMHLFAIPQNTKRV